MQTADILRFWFTELNPKQYYAKDAALDETIRTRFGATLEAAAKCELFAWRDTPQGRLAEVLVLDPVLAQCAPRHAPRLCAGRAGPGAGARAGSKYTRPQPAPGAAQLYLYALHAQRVRAGARAGRGPVFAAGPARQPAL